MAWQMSEIGNNTKLGCSVTHGILVILLLIGLMRYYYCRKETGEFVSLISFEISVSINIIIGHTPFRLRHTVLLLFLSHRKPSNGENHALYYYYAL
jgi:hypothetical protein